MRTEHRRRAPRRAGNYYLRLMGIAGGGVTAAYVLFVFILKVVHPYQLGYAVELDIRQVQTELNRQKARNSLLERRLDYLKTPEGAEMEARRAGWARPGETVYLLRPADNVKGSGVSTP